MIIKSYVTNSGRDVIKDYLNKLPVEERVDAYDVLIRMKNNDFEGLQYKQWEKKIYEVYFKKHNRLFYIVVENEVIYILHACRKQKNKTEKKDARLIRKRAKELSELFGKKFV